MPDRLTPEDLIWFLGPLWQAGALVLFRIEEALEELKPEPFGSCNRRAAELHGAKAHLQARLRVLDPDRFHQVIETISGKVLPWPAIVPTEAMKRAAVEELWTKRPDLAAKRQAMAQADAQRLEAAQARLRVKHEAAS